MPLLTKPYKYQRRGIKLISKFNGRALVADEMGLGKTLQGLGWMIENNVSPTIVVCQATLKWNWAKEAKTHIGVRAAICEGRTPQNSRHLLRAKLIIINYEILAGWLETLLALKPQLIMIDECQFIKNRAAKRSKAVRKLCRSVPHIIGMSGTPLTNRPAELYAILSIVRPDIYRSFAVFAHEFCQPKLKPWGWEYKGARNLGKLHAQLKEHMMIRRMKKDVLKDLPALTRHVMPIVLRDRKEYDEAEDDFIGWVHRNFGKRRANSAMQVEAMVKMGYLRRLAARLKLPDVKEWTHNFFRETDDKLIIFATHKLIIGEIRDEFPRISVVLDGKTKPRMRQTVVEKFQGDTRCRLFVGQHDAAGAGITLTAASTVAFAEIAWTPAQMSQCEARPHRIGQKKNVSSYWLVAQNTIEQDLCRINEEKQGIIDATLDGIEQSTMPVFEQLLANMKERRG